MLTLERAEQNCSLACFVERLFVLQNKFSYWQIISTSLLQFASNILSRMNTSGGTVIEISGKVKKICHRENKRLRKY